MIALKSEEYSLPYSLIASQVSQDGRFGWFIATWHPESHPVLEEIYTHLKLEILNSDIQQISKLNIEAWLKKFFADYHWKLYAQLRKTDLKERGLSLWMGVLYDHELFFVQFGRLLCGVADKKRLNPLGTAWQHFRVRSFEQLGLLGDSEKDIKPKVVRTHLDESQKLVVLPAVLAERVYSLDADAATLETLVEANATEDKPLWLIMEAKPRLFKPMQRRISRLQISTFVLLFFSILTIIYMIFGNRFIDQGAKKLSLIFQDRKTVNWEQLPNYLNLDTSKIIKQLERIVNLPARDIEFRISWTTDLPYEITATPVFNIENLYIASDDKLLAYNKKNRQLVWMKSLTNDIRTMTPIQGALLVVLNDGIMISIREDGSESWRSTLTNPICEDRSRFPLELRNEDDPRLDAGILVAAEKRGIRILSSLRGELLSRISFNADIDYLSAYDAFDNCFYVVVEGEIVCIELRIQN